MDLSKCVCTSDLEVLDLDDPGADMWSEVWKKPCGWENLDRIVVDEDEADALVGQLEGMPYEGSEIWAEALVRYKEGEPLHLDNELAGMALKEQQIAMEVDEREGMVRDYLEMPLPERWDKMDIFDRRNYICGSEFGGEREPGVRKRERVCNMEIWCECFGKERGNLKRQDANEISAIMANIEGWKKADNKVRFPIYGIVRGYCRDRETTADWRGIRGNFP